MPTVGGRTYRSPTAAGGHVEPAGKTCRSAAWGGGERTASVAAPAKLLYKDVLDDSVRSRAEVHRAFRRVAALRPGAAAGCRSLAGSKPFGLLRHVLFLGRSLRSARMLAKAAGLRVREASARRTCVRFPFGPQPSGGASNLRASYCPPPGGGCCAIARTRSGRSLQRIRTNGRELRPADGCDVEPSAFMRSSHGQQLAKGRPMRAFAGQSCGPPR